MALASLVIAGLIQTGPLVPVRIGEPARVDVASRPLSANGAKFSIFRAGECLLKIDGLRIEPAKLPVDLPTTPPGVYGVRWNYMPPPPQPQPTFTAERGTFLKVVLKASVLQYTTMDYRVSAAVFDKNRHLLGTAQHVEKVEYVRVGRTPIVLKEIKFDFGNSDAYRQAAFVAFAVSDTPVPRPPDL